MWRREELRRRCRQAAGGLPGSSPGSLPAGPTFEPRAPRGTGARMSIYNYVRPLWRNGPHVLHDAPPRVRVAFDLLFGRHGTRRHDDGGGDEIRVHRVRPLDLTVAWLQAEVELPVAGTSFSYRRARYLHAIAAEHPGERTLSPRRARALFEGVYGRDLLAGIRSAQRWLHAFEHPADIDRGRALFAHEEPRARPFETGERRAPERLQRVAGSGATRRTSQDIGRVVLAEAARPPAAALHAATDAATDAVRAAGRSPERGGPADAPVAPRPAPSIASTAALFAASPARPAAEPGAVSRAETPVEAFDRALTRRDCAPGDPARESEPGPAAQQASAKGTGPSASLSALLHARLSCDLIPADPNDPTPPHRDASESAA